MKLAALSFLSLAPLAAAQTTIAREVVAEVTVTAQDFASGTYTRDLATSGGRDRSQGIAEASVRAGPATDAGKDENARAAAQS